MNWDAFLHLIPYFLSFGISFSVGLYAWKRRTIACALTFAIFAYAEAFYTFIYIFELISSSLKYKILMDNIEWIPALIAPVTLFAFGLRYSGSSLFKPKLTWQIIGGTFIIFVIMIITDNFYPILRSSVALKPGNPFSALVYDFTFLSGLMIIYIYFMSIAGLYILLSHFIRTKRLYRAQAGTVLFGAAVPFIGSILTVLSISPSFQQDTTPFTFAVSNVIIAWGLFRYHLLDVVPAARNTVVDEINAGVFVLDVQNRLVDINRAGEVMLDMNSRDIIGKTGFQVFSKWPDLVEKFRDVKEIRCDLTIDDDRQKYFLDVSISPLHDRRNHFTGRVILVRDITEKKRIEEELKRHRDHLEELVKDRTSEITITNKKLRDEMNKRERLEEQYRQAQKMEAIGQLAGGVAHDFNNLLTAIMGYSDLLLKEFDEHTLEYTNIKEIKKAAERAETLTMQLLAFSRKQVLQPKVLNLNEIIGDMEKMLGRLIGENISISTNLNPDIGLVEADPGQIQQVLMNLCINARDAMPDGGDLIIETESGSSPEVFTEGSSTESVILKLTDNGVGMDTNTQTRIFEPFFTTKESGKGTGLGLATVHGIIKQSGGSIAVESSKGNGTCFKIYLPVTNKKSVTSKKKKQPATKKEGSEMILLVEDDEAVRILAQTILIKHGYQVLETDIPEKALTIYKEYAGKIKLVITDMRMPGQMDGFTLTDNLKKLYPDVRILYMSGYSDERFLQDGKLDETINFLPKPFSPDALTNKVREVLDLD